MVKSAQPSRPPTDRLHHALHVGAGTANPITDGKRAFGENNHAGKKVGQCLLGGKGDNRTADAAESKKSGNGKTQ